MEKVVNGNCFFFCKTKTPWLNEIFKSLEQPKNYKACIKFLVNNPIVDKSGLKCNIVWKNCEFQKRSRIQWRINEKSSLETS